jgi:hypothetical protein
MRRADRRTLRHDHQLELLALEKGIRGTNRIAVHRHEHSCRSHGNMDQTTGLVHVIAANLHLR